MVSRVFAALAFVAIAAGCVSRTGGASATTPPQPHNTEVGAWSTHYAQAFHYAEMEQWEKASEEIRQAIEIAEQLPFRDWRVIESYDDAALYSALKQNAKAAIELQSIAVLLAHGEPLHQQLFPQYVARLASLLNDDGSSTSVEELTADPTFLLNDPASTLCDNIHIRSKFRGVGQACAGAGSQQHGAAKRTESKRIT